MTRWHSSQCHFPDVFITKDNWPSCRSCGKTCPQAEYLIAQQNIKTDSWSLPADEPRGQMNLCWPKSVRYAPAKQQHEPPPDESGSDVPTSCDEISSIYGRTLGTNEFRLAGLSTAPSDDYPLHITLETFADENFPEYECTSYSWGGEEGDSSLSKPIFIGDYWDVLLQTKNCWSMFRFLRPWRGTRMVWVDAVSINQANTEERGTQVAKMRQIYEGSSRVVVYLGPEIVTSTTRFPVSRPLTSIETDDVQRPLFPPDHQYHNMQYNLHELLSRRYFSRVWVIQELVVSERAVIRVGDVDFRADARIIGEVSHSYLNDLPRDKERYNSQMSRSSYDWLHNEDLGDDSSSTSSDDTKAEEVPDRLRLDQDETDIETANSFHMLMASDADLEQDWSSPHELGPSGLRCTYPWLSSPAPWVQHLAHKVFPLSEIKDIVSLLRLTANSSASDPRDRLFGVISLLHNADLRHLLAPDYSLSFQHFSIGLFAHLLLNDRRYWFFQKAGLAANKRCFPAPGWPSWVPRCRSDFAWRQLFLDAPELAPSQSRFHATTPFPLYFDEKSERRVPRTRCDATKQSPLGDAIDPHTGALLIDVAHVLSFHNDVLLEQEYGDLAIYSIQRHVGDGVLKSSRLLLVILRVVDIQPWHDHLYIPVSMPETYLILRRSIDVAERPTFELVTACVRLFDRERIQDEELECLASQKFQNPEAWSKVGAMPDINRLRLSVATEIHDLRSVLRSWSWSRSAGTTRDYLHCTLLPHNDDGRLADPKFKHFFLWSICPPHLDNTWDEDKIWRNVLRLCLAIHREEDSEFGHIAPMNNGLEDTYLKLINRDFFDGLGGTGQSRYIDFSVPLRDWKRRWYGRDFYDPIYNPHEQANPSVPLRRELGFWWTWRLEGNEGWRTAKELADGLRQRKGILESLKVLFQRDNGADPYDCCLVIRASLPVFMDQLREHLCRAQQILRRIIEAHSSAPNLEYLLHLAKTGPTKEQDTIWVTKYLADVEIKGGIESVSII